MTHCCVSQSNLDIGNIPRWAPSFRDKRLASYVVVEQIEGLVNRLLFLHYVLPTREALANVDKLHAPAVTGIVENHLEIL